MRDEPKDSEELMAGSYARIAQGVLDAAPFTIVALALLATRFF
jgi:hypothetical protein